MADTTYTLIIDSPDLGSLSLELIGSDGHTHCGVTREIIGHVDNFLLTAVDDLFKSLTIQKSALTTVSAGSEVDKNSSLYRMVNSFGSAVSVSRVLPGAGSRRRK